MTDSADLEAIVVVRSGGVHHVDTVDPTLFGDLMDFDIVHWEKLPSQDGRYVWRGQSVAHDSDSGSRVMRGEFTREERA